MPVAGASWQVLDPPRRRIAAPDGDIEPARRARDCPALDQQRQQHHHERDVEIDRRMRQADQERDRGEEDADRAAQPHQGDERLLARGEAERRKKEETKE